MDDYDDDNISDEYPGSPDIGSEEDGIDEGGKQAIQTECCDLFATTDFIMEPTVISTLERYIIAGGPPEKVVELLSVNYKAVAQTVNVMAEWLIMCGVNIEEIQDTVESHLKDMIVKNFDPKKADSIFTHGGDTPGWLSAMIEFPTWRKLFYTLAEYYPDCLMLNFTVKLISDAGYQGEITSVATACHQVEVFSRVLRTHLTNLLEGGEECLEEGVLEFAKLVCHGEHTYLYSQMLMHFLVREHNTESGIRRLCQELQRSAMKKGFDVVPITLGLSGAGASPTAHQALCSMLSRKALNPADITLLFRLFSEVEPPPVNLIRIPVFLDLLVETLFRPNCSPISSEHKPKYVFLLSYAVSVLETYCEGVRKSINRDELKVTQQAVDRTQVLCQSLHGCSDLFIADMPTLFTCLKFPVCAKGVLRWADHIMSLPAYFELNTDHTPLHLVLVDEIGTNHPLLHGEVLDLLVRLFENSYDELNVHVRLELKKMILDRMVHLLSQGSGIAVISYVHKCISRQDTDISLIRHFVSEVLDVIAPPYTSQFSQLFLPLLENKDITGILRSEDGTDPVSSFIKGCSTG